MNTPRKLSRLFSVGLLAALTPLAVWAADAPAPAPIPYFGVSPATVAKLNAAFKKAIIAQDAETAAIFAANPGLSGPYQVNSAIVPAPFQPARHDGFVEIAKKGDIDLLLAGDSITDWWATNGKAAYAKYFGDYKVANFAIAGDTTQGVLYRLQNGEGQGFQPKAIMLMIGTNNTGRNSATEIADGVVADLNELRKDFPNAKILLLGVFPRGLPTDAVRKTIADINTLIAKLDDQKHIFYMDIGPKFLDANGTLLPGTFLRDNLHPTEAGYEIWGEAVKDKIAELMK